MNDRPCHGLPLDLFNVLPDLDSGHQDDNDDEGFRDDDGDSFYTLPESELSLCAHAGLAIIMFIMIMMIMMMVMAMWLFWCCSQNP